LTFQDVEDSLCVLELTEDYSVDCSFGQLILEELFVPRYIEITVELRVDVIGLLPELLPGTVTRSFLRPAEMIKHRTASSYPEVTGHRAIH
jgi:hypothetical protein